MSRRHSDEVITITGPDAVTRLLDSVWSRCPQVLPESRPAPEDRPACYQLLYRFRKDGPSYAIVRKGYLASDGSPAYTGEVRQMNSSVGRALRRHSMQQSEWDRQLKRERSRLSTTTIGRVVKYGGYLGLAAVSPWLFAVTYAVKRHVNIRQEASLNNRTHGMMFYGALTAVAYSDARRRDFNAQIAEAILQCEDIDSARRLASRVDWTPEGREVWEGVRGEVDEVLSEAERIDAGSLDVTPEDTGIRVDGGLADLVISGEIDLNPEINISQKP